MVEGRRFGFESATANARADQFGMWRAIVSGCVAAALLTGCAVPLVSRKSDREGPAAGLPLTRVVTITRGPDTFVHQHVAILSFIGFKREVPAPIDLALVAQKAIDDVFARQAPDVAITHLPETDPDANAVLASDCLARTSSQLSSTCQALFDGVRTRQGAEVLIVIDDWKARNMIGTFGSSGTGAGVYSRRNEGNAVRAVIISHMGVHALVKGQPEGFVAPPCHNEGFIPRELDASMDPEQLDLAQLQWLELDFRRTISTAVYRALAPSGVLNINPRACWDRSTEGKHFPAPPI